MAGGGRVATVEYDTLTDYNTMSSYLGNFINIVDRNNVAPIRRLGKNEIKMGEGKYAGQIIAESHYGIGLNFPITTGGKKRRLTKRRRHKKRRHTKRRHTKRRRPTKRRRR